MIVTYARDHVALASQREINTNPGQSRQHTWMLAGVPVQKRDCRLAYEQASEKGFIKGGVNRILLTTDAVILTSVLPIPKTSKRW